MKGCKNQTAIKGFRKKSVWPSIVLFLIFLCFGVGLIAAIVSVFEGYMIDSKLADIYEDAEYVGRALSAHIEEGNLEDAISSLEGALKKENGVCITDRDRNVLLNFGEAQPDFGHMELIELFDTYMVLPDAGAMPRDWENMLMLPVGELWERTMTAPKVNGPGGGRDWEIWLKEEIFTTNCWIETPLNREGYHLYFRDCVTLVRKDIFYLLVVGMIAMGALSLPIIFLFINVLSTIVMQRRMLKLLYLDTTTGGNNWVYFVHQGKKILCRMANSRNAYVMVNLHLDRYQDYCACYGGKSGEELLENIVGFLQSKVGRGEIFARFAKADFGILLKCESKEQSEKRLKKMLAELKGIRTDKKLNFHAGLYVIEPIANQKGEKKKYKRQVDVDQVYHYANAARVNIMRKEGAYIGVFDQQILEEQLWKRKVEDTMESALLNQEFQIYLQPKYSPLSEKLVGAEALVRWLSPTDGLIPPGRFIPIFEENGFITQLDDYMISGVAKLQSEWKLQGKKAIPVSVNVSRANFTKENLAEHICHLVDAYGADHGKVELELTESAFFGDKEMLQKIIKELKMYGFPISMDDFGAGYSSLNSLKDLPIDVLKLDMDFFRGEDVEKRGEIVVRETIQLAKNLNMKIVAEGIERKEQVEFLAEQGCDMIQGYYFAKPMTVQEFDERVQRDS
ncbi:MAG: EAL domain-containing protein [Roseburia sp.]|nr:EAL domain-containing protein [Roseburia sp.]